MKKLIVLSMVVVMASLATAALTLDIAGDTLTVTSSDAEPYVAWIGYSSPTLDAAIVALTAAGDQNLSYVAPQGVFDMAGFGFPEIGNANMTQFSVASSTVGAVQAGGHLTLVAGGLVFGAEDLGLGRVDIISEDLSTIIATAYVVPEPMTMGLLGLGGLFLRRRK